MPDNFQNEKRGCLGLFGNFSNNYPIWLVEASLKHTRGKIKFVKRQDFFLSKNSTRISWLLSTKYKIQSTIYKIKKEEKGKRKQIFNSNIFTRLLWPTLHLCRSINVAHLKKYIRYLYFIFYINH